MTSDGKIVLEFNPAVVTNVMKPYADAGDLPTNMPGSSDNADGLGTKLQDSDLPTELGGGAGKRRASPTGPKDDGNLASKISYFNLPKSTARGPRLMELPRTR